MFFVGYTKKIATLTVLKSPRECFWVSRSAWLSCSGPRSLYTCTSEGSSCRPGNPDRCHLIVQNKRTENKYLLTVRCSRLRGTARKRFNGQFAKPGFVKSHHI